MNREILLLAEQIKETYEGDPWFGRSVKALLAEVNDRIAFERPNEQHSILELVWHMITWREFTISRLRREDKDLHYFEVNDWRGLDHGDKNLWHQGLQRLQETQHELTLLMQQQDDAILSERVEGREYDFRTLLNGIIQHDIYHTGQIAYLTKLLKNKK
jgi:uncharacterized damage-inducible protein DinB